MTNREKFIEEIAAILTKDNKKIEDKLSTEAFNYWNEIIGKKAILGGVTKVGIEILDWLIKSTSVNTEYFSAKEIAEGIFSSARAVSGAARKLVADKYLIKEGGNPVRYKVTDKGKQILEKGD